MALVLLMRILNCCLPLHRCRQCFREPSLSKACLLNLTTELHIVLLLNMVLEHMLLGHSVEPFLLNHYPLLQIHIIKRQEAEVVLCRQGFEYIFD